MSARRGRTPWTWWTNAVQVVLRPQLVRFVFVAVSNFCNPSAWNISESGVMMCHWQKKHVFTIPSSNRESRFFPAPNHSNTIIFHMNFIGVLTKIKLLLLQSWSPAGGQHSGGLQAMPETQHTPENSATFMVNLKIAHILTRPCKLGNVEQCVGSSESITVLKSAAEDLHWWRVPSASDLQMLQLPPPFSHTRTNSEMLSSVWEAGNESITLKVKSTRPNLGRLAEPQPTCRTSACPGRNHGSQVVHKVIFWCRVLSQWTGHAPSLHHRRFEIPDCLFSQRLWEKIHLSTDSGRLCIPVVGGDFRI